MPSVQKANSTIPIAPTLHSTLNSKHLKRHSKPFGCTHDACNKVFGAKNDWKRHENSQHHQLECWKCDIRCHITTFGTDAASICGKCFFRKADFVKHLKVVHGNTDGWLVNPDQASTTGDHVQATSTMTGTRSVVQILVDCHIPKYHGGAFWCGFCKKVIKLHGKVGIEGWDKRFDHIAWHFEKDNLRVKDAWMRLEEPSPDDDQKATGVLGTKHGEESTDDEEDVELLDSPPKRRQTEPKTLSSFSRQSENAETDKVEGARWYCVSSNPISLRYILFCTSAPYITDVSDDGQHLLICGYTVRLWLRALYHRAVPCVH